MGYRSLENINRVHQEERMDPFTPGLIAVYFRTMYLLRLLRKINVIDANMTSASQFGLYNNTIWADNAELTKQYHHKHKKLIDRWIYERYLCYLHRGFCDLNTILSELPWCGAITLLPVDESAYTMLLNELTVIAKEFDTYGYCISHMSSSPKICTAVETLDILLTGIHQKNAIQPSKTVTSRVSWEKIKKDTWNTSTGGPILKLCEHLCSMAMQYDHLPVDPHVSTGDRAQHATVIKMYGSFLSMLMKLLSLVDQSNERKPYRSLDEGFDHIYCAADYASQFRAVPLLSMLNEYIHHTDMNPDVAVMLVDAPVIFSDLYRPKEANRVNVDEDVTKFLIVECICRQEEVAHFAHKMRKAHRISDTANTPTDISDEVRHAL